MGKPTEFPDHVAMPLCIVERALADWLEGAAGIRSKLLEQPHRFVLIGEGFGMLERQIEEGPFDFGQLQVITGLDTGLGKLAGELVGFERAP